VVFDFPYEGRGHGLADIEFSMNEMDIFGFSELNNSYSLAFLFNGQLRAEEATASAAVTQLGENKDIIFKNCYGIVCANFSTLAAISALFLVDLRNGKEDWLALVNVRLKEKSSIGLFNITVQELDGIVVFEG
jgi:hypothetical protein